MRDIKKRLVPEMLELKEHDKQENEPKDLEVSDNLGKLIAEIIVENLIKKYRNGRHRICQDQ